MDLFLLGSEYLVFELRPVGNNGKALNFAAGHYPKLRLDCTGKQVANGSGLIHIGSSGVNWIPLEKDPADPNFYLAHIDSCSIYILASP